MHCARTACRIRPVMLMESNIIHGIYFLAIFGSMAFIREVLRLVLLVYVLNSDSALNATDSIAIACGEASNDSSLPLEGALELPEDGCRLCEVDNDDATFSSRSNE